MNFRFKPLLVLFLFLPMALAAQEKGDVYYAGHPDELLVDAEALFQKGNYDRALQLCDLHKELLGSEHTESESVEELRSMILDCQKLAIDMENYIENGRESLAKAVAEELRKLNPSDERLKRFGMYTAPGKKKPVTDKQAAKDKARKEAEAAAAKEKAQQEAEAAAAKEKAQKEAEAAAAKEKERQEAEAAAAAAAAKEKARQEAEAAEKAKKQEEARKKAEEKDDLEDDDYYKTPRTVDYVDEYEPKFVAKVGAGLVGLGNQAHPMGIQFGGSAGIYDIAESIFGAEARVNYTGGLASKAASLFGIDACAVVRVFDGIYPYAGAGWFVCTENGDSKYKTNGLCVPFGVSIIIGGHFVIDVGASYYPAVSVWTDTSVKTTAGPQYKIKSQLDVFPASLAPRIGLGVAF